LLEHSFETSHFEIDYCIAPQNPKTTLQLSHNKSISGKQCQRSASTGKQRYSRHSIKRKTAGINHNNEIFINIMIGARGLESALKMAEPIAK